MISLCCYEMPATTGVILYLQGLAIGIVSRAKFIFSRPHTKEKMSLARETTIGM